LGQRPNGGKFLNIKTKKESENAELFFMDSSIGSKPLPTFKVLEGDNSKTTIRTKRRSPYSVTFLSSID